MGAGHGGASGRYDRLREIASDYAFILRSVER
jgi:oligopeptidase B